MEKFLVLLALTQAILGGEDRLGRVPVRQIQNLKDVVDKET